MAAQRRHQVVPATITAAGNSGVGANALANLGQANNPTVVAYLTITGPVTGTTPSLTVSVNGSQDGNNWASIGSFTAQTAATPANTAVRLVLHDVLDPFLQVSWTVSGTTPSFGGVEVDLYMTSPDY